MHHRLNARILTGLLALVFLFGGAASWGMKLVSPPPEYYVIIGSDLYYANFSHQRFETRSPRHIELEIKRAIFADSSPEPYNAALLDLQNPPIFGCEVLSQCLLKMRRSVSEIQHWDHLTTLSYYGTDEWGGWKIDDGVDSIGFQAELVAADLDETTRGVPDQVTYVTSSDTIVVTEADLIDYELFGQTRTTQLGLELDTLDGSFVDPDRFALLVRGAAWFLRSVPEDVPTATSGACWAICWECNDDSAAGQAGRGVSEISQCDSWSCRGGALSDGLSATWGAASACAQCRLCQRRGGTSDPPDLGDCLPLTDYMPCPQNPEQCCPLLHCPDGYSPCNGNTACCANEWCDEDWSPLYGCDP